MRILQSCEKDKGYLRRIGKDRECLLFPTLIRHTRSIGPRKPYSGYPHPASAIGTHATVDHIVLGRRTEGGQKSRTTRRRWYLALLLLQLKAGTVPAGLTCSVYRCPVVSVPVFRKLSACVRRPVEQGSRHAWLEPEGVKRGPDCEPLLAEVHRVGRLDDLLLEEANASLAVSQFSSFPDNAGKGPGTLRRLSATDSRPGPIRL